MGEYEPGSMLLRGGIGMRIDLLGPAVLIATSASPAWADCPADPAATLTEIIAADNRGDLDAVMRLYTADPVWVRPAGGPIRGAAAIRASYVAMYRDFAPALTIAISASQRGADVAVVRGRTGGELAPRAGGAARHVGDDFEAILLCDRQRWRVSVLAWGPVRFRGASPGGAGGSRRAQRR